MYTSMFETFTHLNKSHEEGDGMTTRKCLHEKFDTIEKISNKFICMSYSGGYRVYDKTESFVQALEQMPESERIFHEVIHNRPQKLKFDIDADVEKINKIFACKLDTMGDYAAGYDAISGAPCCLHGAIYDKWIFRPILKAITDVFYGLYGYCIDILICASHSSDNLTSPSAKFSNHIIIPDFHVSNHMQAQFFTKTIVEVVGNNSRAVEFIDTSVNKSVQNFRIPLCHKEENVNTMVGLDSNKLSYRSKRIITKHTVLDAIITHVVGGFRLPDTVNGTATDNITSRMSDVDIQAVLKACGDLGILDGHTYRGAKNNQLQFDLNDGHTTDCDFCNRMHIKDNTLIISLGFKEGEINIYRRCRKSPGSKYVTTIPSQSTYTSLKTRSAENAAADELKKQNWVNTQIANAIDSNKPQELITGDNGQTYCENKLREFELVPTLIIQAMMKMGKTKALADYIVKNFPDVISPIIRFISFRQTFSGNIKSKFTDFTLYSDVSGPLSAAKLIVQVESLHRLEIYNGIQQPDLLVLDECESIFEQFGSGLLGKNFNDCFAKFQYLMRASKHVVLMDANVGYRTLNIVRQMRPLHDITFHHNTYKNATQDNYFITGEFAKWFGMLHASIDSNDKVVIPISSIKEAEGIYHSLTAKYPDKMIKLYSSKTLASEKTEHFANVNHYWKGYDILIYTPTISAGVSFEEVHYDKIFAYFTDQSCPAETCMQMIGRIRDVSTHSFFIYLAASGHNMPVSRADIKKRLYTQRTELMEDNGVRFEYNNMGKVKIHKTDYFHIWLENTRMKNISANALVSQIISIMQGTGATCKLITDEDYQEYTGEEYLDEEGKLSPELALICKSHKATKTGIKVQDETAVANANDLNEEEASAIRMSKADNKDITTEQHYELEKYNLRRAYKFQHEITRKFVHDYGPYKTKLIYKNLVALNRSTSATIALEILRDEEVAFYGYVMNNDGTQHNDLTYRYTFHRLKIVEDLIKMLGWNGIYDKRVVTKSELQHKITLPHIVRRSMDLCSEIGGRVPSVKTTLDIYLKCVNAGLTDTYGLSIRKDRLNANLYCLSLKDLFTYDPTNEQMPYIPRPNDIGPNIQAVKEQAEKINIEELDDDELLELFGGRFQATKLSEVEAMDESATS